MRRKDTKKFKLISLKTLSLIANVSYYKIYNRITGRYDTITYSEETQLANALHDELVPIFKSFGFRIEIRRIK